MSNKLRIALSIAIAGVGLVIPAAAQVKATGVLLKVAVPTVIAGHTLQPGNYEVSSWTEPDVLTIQKTGTGQTSMFVLPTAVSEGNRFRGVATPALEASNNASGVPTITSIYFPAQDRAYYFSTKIEERGDVTHGQPALTSTAAQ